MHDCLTEQAARTGCKCENASEMPVWRRARAREPADAAIQARFAES